MPDLVEEEDLSWTRVFFDTAPDRNGEAHALLARLGDDSPTYYWRVLAAQEIMRLYREDRDRLQELDLLHAAKGSAEEALHPPFETERFADATDLQRAWDDDVLHRLPNDPVRLGFAVDRTMGELAPRLGQPRELYRGLRAEALAALVYIGTRVQELSAATRPLEVTSSVRDDAYQELLRSGNSEAAHGYSLHTTGYAFDIRRRYESGAQAQAFQFLLDDLTARNLIAWIREPGAIHITVSSEADVLVRCSTARGRLGKARVVPASRSSGRRRGTRAARGTRSCLPARSAFSASCCRISCRAVSSERPEPAAELDARLQRVALGRPLVATRRGGARPRARAPRSRGRSGFLGHLVLEGQPVEVEAALGGQVRVVAADDGDAVGVLHRADEVRGLVAGDRHRLPRDARRLVGETVRGLEPRARRRASPSPCGSRRTRRSDERGDDAEPDEEPADGASARRGSGSKPVVRLLGRLAAARELFELLRALARVREPDFLVALATSDELVGSPLEAETLAVDVLRPPVRPRRDARRGARRRGTELEPERDEEDEPERNHRAQLVRPEDPGEHEHDERDAHDDPGLIGQARLRSTPRP